jgi:hypothetical protein
VNLTWRIVRKDQARLAWPLAGWITFAVGTTAWFGMARPPGYASTADIYLSWIGRLQGFGLGGGVLLQATVGVLLAAELVIEDPPSGTTAFWLARPISERRMLAAKAIGAGLLFAVGPALVLSPVWLAFGFGWPETLLAALEFVAWQLVITGPALALGVATGSRGWFALAAVGLWLLVVATVVTGKETEAGRSGWVDLRDLAVVGTLVLGAVLTLIRGYLGRCRAWAILVATLVVMIAVRLAWRRGEASAVAESRVGSAALVVSGQGRLEGGGDRLLEEALVRESAVAGTARRSTESRGRVLWEVPLREGEGVQAGSACARIVHLGWSEDRKQRRLVLYERDARLAFDYGVHRNTGTAEGRWRDKVKVDQFLLVNRSRGYAKSLTVHEVGAARMNSVMATARILEFAPAVPIGAEFARWDEGATLVKVRWTGGQGGAQAHPAAGRAGAGEGTP